MLTVAQVLSEETTPDACLSINTEEDMLFPLESHLSDFLVENIDTIKINSKKA